MTNKHASKQHGLVGNIRPKSKLRNRRNKQLAKARKEERNVVTTTNLDQFVQAK
jgi:hypothetical protein